VKPSPEAVPDVDPVVAYGPDDPAYGPPGPDWYKRGKERDPRAEGAAKLTDTGAQRAARGPFEPLRPGEREEAGHADYQPSDDYQLADDYLPEDYQPGDTGAALDDPGDGPGAESPDPEPPGSEPADDEMSQLLDFGAGDPDADSLGQIRDLYERAETVSQASLDRHFEQLLERQRELISEYFRESGGLSGAEAVPLEPLTPAPFPSAPAAADQAAANPTLPLGFDSAESLAGLRGGLRGAQ
jgi:hypothetical protein